MAHTISNLLVKSSVEYSFSVENNMNTLCKDTYNKGRYGIPRPFHLMASNHIDFEVVKPILDKGFSLLFVWEKHVFFTIFIVNESATQALQMGLVCNTNREVGLLDKFQNAALSSIKTVCENVKVVHGITPVWKPKEDDDPNGCLHEWYLNHSNILQNPNFEDFWSFIHAERALWGINTLVYSIGI